MGPERLAKRPEAAEVLWEGEGEGLIGHNHKKYYVYLESAFEEKTRWKFFLCFPKATEL